MNIKLWGCRGSLPTPGPEKNIYGGNTACIEVVEGDTYVILDGGSGIQRLGQGLSKDVRIIHILLTHLHLDHIIGLGFFSALYNPAITVHIWGPVASHESLKQRLRRYFSPPIFPVRLSELPAKVEIHDIVDNEFAIGNLKLTAEYICHPGPTVGYRLQCGKAVVAYIPDHEPALASACYPCEPDWTSGYNLAKDAGILIHDAQYKIDEYENHLGWGHSSMKDALEFGILTSVKKLLFFHHDPYHSDEQLQQLFTETLRDRQLDFEVELAQEGKLYTLQT